MLKRRMNQQNNLLEPTGDQLKWFEVIGGRLYTGPLFVKYNGILRGLDSPVPFLKNSLIQLCCAKDIFERYLGASKIFQPANGTLSYERAKREVNMYTTTIHVINSCIVKLGKLTRAKPVYRGMSWRIFPEQFWKPNEQGVMGGVECALHANALPGPCAIMLHSKIGGTRPLTDDYMSPGRYAFMSTTPRKSVAEQYSQDNYGIIVEIQQGMIDRGAEISWLSQVTYS